MLNRAIERVPKISLMVHLFITGTILDCNIQIEYIWLYLNVMILLVKAIFTVVENRFLHKNDENEYNTEVNGKMEVVTQE